MAKLNQIIAIESGTKKRVYGEITELHKSSQKPDLFAGFTKVYRKKDDEGEEFPPEKKKVQMLAEDALRRVRLLQTELIDLTLRKDIGNCSAKGTIAVDGMLLAEDVPATHLLFLEKQFTDLYTFIEKLPVLDEADEWQADEATGLFRSEPVETHRTKKTTRPIVLYDATDKHPAQTQLIVEDVVIGYWQTVKLSGALPVAGKQVLMRRVEKLLAAIKQAREAANETPVGEATIAEKLFEFIFE